MRQKVANYPGVTVEHHSDAMKSIGRSDLTRIDLPGIYSAGTILGRRRGSRWKC